MALELHNINLIWGKTNEKKPGSAATNLDENQKSSKADETSGYPDTSRVWIKTSG